MTRAPRILAYGELLWDLLPGGPALGGAPANFAVTLAGLMNGDFSESEPVALVSSVGGDARGATALAQLRERKVCADWIARDAVHPTGTVEVTLHAGIASYAIRDGAAWDFIPRNEELLAAAPRLAMLYFGTLAQRAATSRTTLQALADATPPGCLRVLDVNLRTPWWTPEILRWSCSTATVVKMSAEEIPQLIEALALDVDRRDIVDAARSLLQAFAVRLVAITRGAEGCLLITREAVVDQPGIPVRVVDTIGSGDAFTAGLTCALLHSAPLQQAALLANRCGAWVASRQGGMPPMTVEDRNRLLGGIF
jgi:fructokinase